MSEDDLQIQLEFELMGYRVRLASHSLQRIVDSLREMDQLRDALRQMGPGAATGQVSLPELVKELTPATSTERAVLCLDYLHRQGLKSVNIDDLRKTFQDARLEMPSNLNETMNLLVERGFAAVTTEKKDDKKAWYLTNTGALFVEHGLKEESRR